MANRYSYTVVPCRINRKTGDFLDWTWDGKIFDTPDEAVEYAANWVGRWFLFPDLRVYKVEKGRGICTFQGKRYVRQYISGVAYHQKMWK